MPFRISMMRSCHTRLMSIPCTAWHPIVAHARKMFSIESTTQNWWEDALTRLTNTNKYCSSCGRAGRLTTGAKERKPLGNKSIKSMVIKGSVLIPRLRNPTTRYACRKCKIALCKKWQCISRHLSLCNNLFIS